VGGRKEMREQRKKIIKIPYIHNYIIFFDEN
jgi:hypothetical protein